MANFKKYRKNFYPGTIEDLVEAELSDLSDNESDSAALSDERRIEELTEAFIEMMQGRGYEVRDYLTEVVPWQSMDESDGPDYLTSMTVPLSVIRGIRELQSESISNIYELHQEPYMPLCLPKTFQDLKKRVEYIKLAQSAQEPKIRHLNHMVKAYRASKNLEDLFLSKDWGESDKK